MGNSYDVLVNKEDDSYKIMKVTSDNIESLIEEQVEAKLELIEESEYDDMLDECTPMVQIGTLEYSPSQVLKAVDEVAYELGFGEYVDSRREDVEDEVRTELESQLDDD
tara:strand:- start:1211 stop:1537 length:327 start_codon:yes stop_codon:yes gene_type:complete